MEDEIQKLTEEIKKYNDGFRKCGKEYDWGGCDYWDTRLKIAEKKLKTLKQTKNVEINTKAGI